MAFLLVDGNNIGMRSWSAFNRTQSGLTTSTGIKTTVFVSLLKSIEYAVKFAGIGKIEKCFICWDMGKEYRKGLFPLYKAQRHSMEESDYKDFLDNLNTAQKYFAKLGIPQAQFKGMEADDIIGFLIRMVSKELGKSVITFSDDCDFFQALKHRVRQYRPSSQKIVTETDFIEEYKIEPKYFNRMVAIMGQAKDNIPGCLDIVDGVPKKIGLGEAKAIKLLIRPDGSIRTIREVIEEAPDDKFKEYLVRNRKQMFLSYKLSKLRTRRKDFTKDEYAYLKSMFESSFHQEPVKIGQIRTIADYLEVKNTNIPSILKTIGVQVK